MSFKLLSVALVATASALPQLSPLVKATNDNPCLPCNPQGATGTIPPAIGPDLSPLYKNVLGSVKDIKFQPRSIDARADSQFCCPKSLSCVNVQNMNIAMCYDKFTTNYGFADGSYGSLTTGDYKSGDNTANLLSGDFNAGGKQGNVYAEKASDKPNTATLSIPPQYTGTGVGGAIPGNQLGSIIVYTTTIPGQVITAPTTIPQSVQVNTVNGQAISTTISAKTITQATSIAPITSVATISQQPASSAAPASKGAAANVGVDGSRGTGLTILGALLYALM